MATQQQQQAASTSGSTPVVEASWVKHGAGFIEFVNPFIHLWRALPGVKYAEPRLDFTTTTLFDVFQAHAAQHATDNRPLLGFRPCTDSKLSRFADEYRWINWAEAQRRITCIGSGLVSLFNLTTPGELVGIFCTNCPDWVLCEYGCFRQSLAIAPIYSTLGVGGIAHVVNLTQMKVMFCHISLVGALMKDLDGIQELSLKHIVTVGHEVYGSNENQPKIPDDILAAVTALGIKITSLSELMEAGSKTPEVPVVRPRPDDLMSLIFTSGAEGLPKAAVITHKNAAAGVESMACIPEYDIDLDLISYYSYLPIAHSFEREAVAFIIRIEGKIAFSSGHLTHLVTEMGLAKPNFIAGVPRVWKRIYDKITETVNESSWIKRTVFNWALSAKIQSMRTGVPTWIDYDYYVLNAVRSKLGGNLRWIVSGAAACDPVISEWMEAVFNIKFVQGYGLSETFAGVLVQHNGGAKNVRDSIGCPWWNVTARLMDVPDMGYLSTDVPPRGEICIKGPSVMREYYKNPDATDAAFKDGFFCTGDIGLMHSDGSVSIIDRKKNLFKLAQGEYIALEYVETVCGRAREVAQVWVWGHPLENFLCGVVVPNWESCEADIRAAATGCAPNATRADLCHNKQVKKMILDKMNLAADAAKLPSFQRVKALLLEPETWNVEKNLLTPTFKVRRTELIKVYREPLMALIAEYKADPSNRQ